MMIGGSNKYNFDDGWLVGIDCRVVEHQINHPDTKSVHRASPYEHDLTAPPVCEVIEVGSVERVRDFMAGGTQPKR
jgi:hypothetical protein